MEVAIAQVHEADPFLEDELIVASSLSINPSTAPQPEIMECEINLRREMAVVLPVSTKPSLPKQATPKSNTDLPSSALPMRRTIQMQEFQSGTPAHAPLPVSTQAWCWDGDRDRSTQHGAADTSDDASDASADDVASDLGNPDSGALSRIHSFDHFLASDCACELALASTAGSTPRAELSDVLTLTASCAVTEGSSTSCSTARSARGGGALCGLEKVTRDWQIEELERELGPLDRRGAMVALREARRSNRALQELSDELEDENACLRAEMQWLKAEAAAREEVRLDTYEFSRLASYGRTMTRSCASSMHGEPARGSPEVLLTEDGWQVISSTAVDEDLPSQHGGAAACEAGTAYTSGVKEAAAGEDRDIPDSWEDDADACEDEPACMAVGHVDQPAQDVQCVMEAAHAVAACCAANGDSARCAGGSVSDCSSATGNPGGDDLPWTENGSWGDEVATSVPRALSPTVATSTLPGTGISANASCAEDEDETASQEEYLLPPALLLLLALAGAKVVAVLATVQHTQQALQQPRSAKFPCGASGEQAAPRELRQPNDCDSEVGSTATTITAAPATAEIDYVAESPGQRPPAAPMHAATPCMGPANHAARDALLPGAHGGAVHAVATGGDLMSPPDDARADPRQEVSPAAAGVLVHAMPHAVVANANQVGAIRAVYAGAADACAEDATGCDADRVHSGGCGALQLHRAFRRCMKLHARIKLRTPQA